MSKQPRANHSTDGTPAKEATPDDLTFRAAMRDVKPLVQTPPAQGLATPKPRARLRKRRPAGLNLEESMPLIATTESYDRGSDDKGAGDPMLSNNAVGGGEALSFHRAGVRTQVMRRLRRGLYPIEGELDLHGLSQMAARDLLAEFITLSRDAGHRCVRIIHGKGYRSGARGPVLKIAVNLWLRRHLDVMAFTSARAIDGGTGALYVLLRG
jgi:DNA-nicking Smr family endonuclease